MFSQDDIAVSQSSNHMVIVRGGDNHRVSLVDKLTHADSSTSLSPQSGTENLFRFPVHMLGGEEKDSS